MNETYTRVQVVKNWSDMFTIMNDLKKGDVLSSLLLNSALDQAIRTVQVNQDSLKLNGRHQLLVYAIDVNILGRNVHTTQENAEVLVVAGWSGDQTRSKC